MFGFLNIQLQNKFIVYIRQVETSLYTENRLSKFSGSAQKVNDGGSVQGMPRSRGQLCSSTILLLQLIWFVNIHMIAYIYDCL